MGGSEAQFPMYYAYIIKNSKGIFYKGLTDNLEQRLEQHNTGMTKSIKAYIPFYVVYHETFETAEEAIQREIDHYLEAY